MLPVSKSQSMKKRLMHMYGKLIIDGNAVYEIDEACLLRKREEKRGGQSGCRGIGCPIESFSGSSPGVGRTGIKWRN